MNFEEKTVATGADKESGLPAFNAQAPCPPIAGVNDQCLAGDGYPPWDAETLAAAKAEYARDKAKIDELYRQFLKGHANA